jgi:endo-1,3-1,4-beta-glycanase ExoK
MNRTGTPRRLIFSILVMPALLALDPIPSDNAYPNNPMTFRFRSQADLKPWAVSDGWTNGNVVDTDWRRSQVRLDNRQLQLVLERDPSTTTGYASGEIISTTRYQYGYFEADLKAATGDGIVTGFFTYIGPVHKEPWNEIDVEILGKNTRQVQFTYHVDGKDSGGVVVDLPFDSAASFHRFAFDWQPSYIRWYVDGRLMLTENGSKLPLPTHPQEIVADLWNGRDVDAWLRPFHWTGHPIVATIRCISYRKRMTDEGGCN